MNKFVYTKLFSKNTMKASIFILIFFTTSCALLQHPPKSLDGTWIPIRQEIGGTPLPESVFQGQELIVSDSNYTVRAESYDKSIVRIQRNHIDIYGKEGINTGKHFTASYQLKEDLLTICYNLAGGNYPESFETKEQPYYFLSVFKKKS